MLSKLTSWKGAVEIDGVYYDNMALAQKSASIKDTHNIKIKLLSHKRPVEGKTTIEPVKDNVEYRITVKAYMTKKAEPSFDFMAKWNNNIPMPFCTMIGTIEKETRGMVYMKLHADIYAPVITTCMKCGRPLTNKISQFFGVGPECGGHNYVNPFNSEEELNNAVKAYREQLQKITWEGWIIKSAIKEQEIVK